MVHRKTKQMELSQNPRDSIAPISILTAASWSVRNPEYFRVEVSKTLQWVWNSHATLGSHVAQACDNMPRVWNPPEFRSGRHRVGSSKTSMKLFVRLARPRPHLERSNAQASAGRHSCAADVARPSRGLFANSADALRRKEERRGRALRRRNGQGPNVYAAAGGVRPNAYHQKDALAISAGTERTARSTANVERRQEEHPGVKICHCDPRVTARRELFTRIRQRIPTIICDAHP